MYVCMFVLYMCVYLGKNPVKRKEDTRGNPTESEGEVKTLRKELSEIGLQNNQQIPSEEMNQRYKTWTRGRHANQVKPRGGQ